MHLPCGEVAGQRNLIGNGRGLVGWRRTEGGAIRARGHDDGFSGGHVAAGTVRRLSLVHYRVGGDLRHTSHGERQAKSGTRVGDQQATGEADEQITYGTGNMVRMQSGEFLDSQCGERGEASAHAHADAARSELPDAFANPGCLRQIGRQACKDKAGDHVRRKCGHME